MPVTPKSLISGQSHGTYEKAVAYVAERSGTVSLFTVDYLRALYALCFSIGIRFEIAFGQWCDETDVGKSKLWLTKGNPAGIGALTDGTYVGITYATGAQAARGQLVHLWLYTRGTNLPAELAAYKHLDPRWQAAIDKGKAQSAPTLAGLASSWADNPAYAIQIAAHIWNAFGDIPEGAQTMPDTTIVYGRVPKPVYVDDYIDTFPGMAMDMLGPRMNWGVVWHRMVGTLEGTRQHFRTRGTGLTDYGVGVAGPDRASIDGVIYRWNDPLGDRTGWASGPVTIPWGDGKAFLAEYQRQYGLNIVNRGQVSIEISGQYNTPLTAKSRAAIVALTAYYADLAGIAWDVFPMWGNHGYSFVRWHQEFTGPAYKACPGSVVMAETANLMEAIRARLKTYQLGAVVIPPKPIYVAASIPAWLTEDLATGLMKDHLWTNGLEVWGAEREYTTIRKTPRRASASLSTKNFTGPDIVKGETFTGTHRFGDWVMTPFGTRVYAADLTPEVIIRKR